MKYSDQHTKEFFEKLDSLDEKILVVFWGDHLPGFYKDDEFSKEALLDKYETPLMIYSNFKMETQKEDINILSPIYFMNHVTDLVNVPVSPYIALLMQMETILPAFEKGRYIEDDIIKTSREQLNESTEEMLRDYDLLLFDLTAGEQYSIDQKFFDQP